MNTPLRIPLSMTLPRQHGAWSVLLLGYVLGTAAAGGWSERSALLLVALLAALPLRHTLAWWLRLPASDGRRTALTRWVGLHGLLVMLPGLALVVWADRWLLVPLGAAAALTGGMLTALERARLDRTLAAELAAMLGLSLTVPAAAHVAGVALSAGLVSLWLLAAMVFCGGVLHVRYVVRLGQDDARGAARASVVYHLLVLLLPLLLASGPGGLAPLPHWAWLSLLPATLRALWAALRPPRLSIRRLGFEELAYGAVFVALAAVCFRGYL